MAASVAGFAVRAPPHPSRDGLPVPPNTPTRNRSLATSPLLADGQNGTIGVCAGPGFTYSIAIDYTDAFSTYQGPSAVMVNRETGSGESYDVIDSSWLGFAFFTLRLAGQRAVTEFGHTRRPVRWRSFADSGSASFYTSHQDEIEFEESQLLSYFTIAHEYGHAHHNHALGGLFGTSNCNPHELDLVSSYSCAMSEGLADFFPFALFPSAIGVSFLQYTETFQNQTWNPSGTVLGGAIEGAIAAFLLDLFDDGNSPNGLSGDDDPIASYPGSYLADIIETCSVSSIPPVANGLDDFSYCFEKRIDVAVAGLFPGLPQPVAFGESANEPPGWNADDIRAVLLQNIQKP